MTKFSLSDPWQNFADAGWAKAQEFTGFEDEAMCPVIQEARALGEISVGEALLILADRQSALTAWVMENGYSWLRPEDRECLLRKVDAPTASRMWFLVPDLTDEEDAFLWARFAGEMPLMREMAETGRYPRAKDYTDA